MSIDSRTAQQYSRNLQEEIKEDNNRRARQVLALKFSYLQGEDLKKYRMHMCLNGTSLESLKIFDKLLQCKQ